ncbi:MAG TPA: 2TM domain-containing protein [Candidatus Binatia bacterium]|nr:2TM domain-containing protein [Candidatus Binatia bacterium]
MSLNPCLQTPPPAPVGREIPDGPAGSTSTSSEDLRAVARKRIEDRRGFIPHLVSYALVNGGLVMLWAMGAGRAIFWPGFVLCVWGVGLLVHTWNAFLAPPLTEADIQREITRLQRGSGRGREASLTGDLPRRV